MPTAHVLAFTIIFEGLMTFVGTSPSRDVRMHVALVNHKGHKAVLRLPVYGAIPLEKNDVITFPSLGAGEAKPDNTYDERVPNLLEYVEYGDFDDLIVRKKKRDGVYAYVVLPDGDLSAMGAFPIPAALTRKNGFTNTLCVAPMVNLTSAVGTGEVVITITNEDPEVGTRTYNVKATDKIEIENVPHQANGQGDLHFHEYSRLLESGGRVRRSHESRGKCEDDGTIVVESFPADTRSMTSAMAVFLAPRADCGPTDFP